MNWKADNPKSRYIDDITEEEAKHIAWLAAGQPDYFELTELKATCNGNNIPHVYISFNYYHSYLKEVTNDMVGVFDNLNTYLGSGFTSCYCQKELFAYYRQIGLE